MIRGSFDCIKSLRKGANSHRKILLIRLIQRKSNRWFLCLLHIFIWYTYRERNKVINRVLIFKWRASACISSHNLIWSSYLGDQRLSRFFSFWPTLFEIGKKMRAKSFSFKFASKSSTINQSRNAARNRSISWIKPVSSHIFVIGSAEIIILLDCLLWLIITSHSVCVYIYRKRRRRSSGFAFPINTAPAHGHFSLYATVDGLFSRSVFVMLFSRLFCFFFFLLFSVFPLQLRSTQKFEKSACLVLAAVAGYILESILN